MFGFKNNNVKKRHIRLVNESEIFVQVHFVRERHSYDELSLKNDPLRDKCVQWYETNNNPSTYADAIMCYVDSTKDTLTSIIEKANVDSHYFDKLKESPKYMPSKGEAVSVCMALKLNIAHTRKVLSLCNYTLSNSVKSDLIIRYFVENKYFNRDELEYVLKKVADVELSNL